MIFFFPRRNLLVSWRVYDSHAWHVTEEVAAATCGAAAAAKENGNQVPGQLRRALELQELSNE